MQDRIREPELCRKEIGKNWTTKDRIRENQNHAGQSKGKPEQCRTE
jgi:hypothetical protein